MSLCNPLVIHDTNTTGITYSRRLPHPLQASFHMAGGHKNKYNANALRRLQQQMC